MKYILIALLLACGLAYAGPAVTFDGTDDWIDLAGASALDVGAGTWTIVAWIKSPNVAPYRTIFQRGRRYAGGKRYGLGITAASGLLTSNIDDNTTSTTVNGSEIDTDGNWHFVIVQRTSTTLRILDDLALTGSSPVSQGSLDDANNDGAIGMGNDSGGTWDEIPFNGEMMMIIVYTRDLSISEYQRIFYSGGADYSRKDLVGEWRFSNHGASTGEGVANNAPSVDLSGSGSDGTYKDGSDNSMTVTSGPIRQRRGRR